MNPKLCRICGKKVRKLKSKYCYLHDTEDRMKTDSALILKISRQEAQLKHDLEKINKIGGEHE